MTTSRIVTVIVGISLMIAAFAGVPAKHAQYRTHYQTHLSDGTAVSFTKILAARGLDRGAGVFDQGTTFLVDGGVFGRWVITVQATGNASTNAGHNECLVRFVDTGETLRVTYDKTKQDAEGGFCLSVGQQSVTVREGEVPAFPKSFQPIITTGFSASFVRGLSFVHSIALTCDTARALQTPFLAMWGKDPDPGTLPKVSWDLAPVDCNFDAGFGYPCGRDESSVRADGKLYKSALP